MSLHEYLEQVTSQMRCEKARDMVAQELRNHIEDQTENYVEFGLSKEEAELRAVKQMGDPIEVGTAMDRIHRPRVDYRVIILIAALAIMGSILQIFMLQSAGQLGVADMMVGYSESILKICFNSVLGFLIMLIVMFVDYSFLGKHPLAVWVSFLLVLFIYGQGEPVFFMPQISSSNLSLLSALMTLLYGGIVYSYRNKGYKGIILCLLWLFAGCVVLNGQRGVTLSTTVCFFLTAVMVVSFAVHKGWFCVKKLWGQLVLWCSWLIPAVGLLAAIAAGVVGKSYQTARIRIFLNPYGDPAGNGYVTLTMREGLKNLQLFGASLDGESTYWWYSLNYILEKFGIIAGIILLAAFALLLGKMLSGVVKQQNRLGGLLGVGCVSYLTVTTVLHVLTALTLIPATSAYLPFFSEGTNATLGLYLLLGVYLSVYRNTTILSEKRNEPTRRLRISVERVEEQN